MKLPGLKLLSVRSKKGSNPNSGSLSTNDSPGSANHAARPRRAKFQKLHSSKKSFKTKVSCCTSNSRHRDDGMPQQHFCSLSGKEHVSQNCLHLDLSPIYENISNEKQEQENRRIAEARPELANELRKETKKIEDICSKIDRKKWGVQRLEDEKNLLISDVRKNSILEEMHKPVASTKRDDPLNVTYVAITDIDYLVVQPPLAHRYYVLLVKHKTTVLASEILCGSTATRDIKFDENFRFTSLSPDFKIYLELYQINVPATSPIECRNRLLPKGMSAPQRRNQIASSKFELVSVTAITMDHLLRGYVDEQQGNYFGKVFFGADVTGMLELAPRAFSAPVDFATAKGNGAVFWRHKWCVLDHNGLNMWNSPQEEHHTPPLCIDLLNTTVRKAKQEDFLRPRTVVITSTESAVSQYICFGCDEELKNFLRVIDLAMRALKTNKTICSNIGNRYL